jgi:meso-butanediol dehydrogenase/(S,S)-butanediol dehydrogenase/diacetyl reductase
MATNGGRLAGKVVLLSGTGGGQGRVAARMLVREGAKVVGTDIVSDLAEETADLVRSDGYEMINVSPIDLGVPAEAKQWVDRAVEEYGGIDVLYNNAGLPRFGSFPDMSEEDYRFTVRNELDVLWFSAQAAWSHLVARGGGSIVNVASIAGVIGLRSLPEGTRRR